MAAPGTARSVIAGTRRPRHHRLTHRVTHRPTTGTPTGRDARERHCVGKNPGLHLTLIF